MVYKGWSRGAGGRASLDGHISKSRCKGTQQKSAMGPVYARYTGLALDETRPGQTSVELCPSRSM
jgi:hypothetical protein